MLAAVWLCTHFAPGCANMGQVTEYERQIAELEGEVRERDKRLLQFKAQVDEYRRRLEGARNFKFDPSKVFSPTQLVIDPLTGGSDWDGRPGDDGVTVYLKPLDRDGDIIKAAGEIKIQLLDLAAEAKSLGVYTVPVDDVGKIWYGKMMTQHYTVRCPWNRGPPEHSELTVRAVFVDYLTQRVLTAQSTCTVQLPP